MKVSLKPAITNQNFKSIKNVKKSVTKSAKELAEDLYEKRMAKEIRKRVLVSRDHPNWCDAPEDGYVNRTIAQKICYYPEDVEKMKGMSEDMMVKFKKKLYKEGKFYYDKEGRYLDGLEEYLEKYGFKLEDFIIKD